jgi:3-oxoadipate enol-lactonase
MNTIEVNGMQMAYRDLGRKHAPTLLLIHGFPLDHRMWAAQLAGISDSMRVVAPDLRGHGRSELPQGPVSMDTHADDLAALLDRLEIERAVIAGLSMGGYVAFAFWRRHASRVRALVLLDTRAEPDSPQAQANRDAAIARAPQVGAAAYADEMLPRLLAPESMADPRIKGAATAIMAAQPVAGTVAALGALRDRADSRPTLPTITAPALVIVGEHDALTPPADAAAMAAAIPGARMAVVPHAGHLSPLENPRAVNRLLRGFVKESGPS